MKSILIALALLAGIAAPTLAVAGNCQTTCYGSGNYRTCNTYCW